MKNNSIEIDLRELLNYVLKKWRTILIVTVSLAVLAGAFKLVSGLSGKTETATLSSVQQEEVDMLTEDLEELQADLDDVASLAEYNEKSLLMKIDPFNEYVGSFVIYIPTDYQANSAIYPAEISNRYVMAYSIFLNSDEFYNYIFENSKDNSDINNEIRYLKELFEISADSEASMITVTCYGENEARVREITELAKQAINEKSGEISSVIGSHEYTIMMDSVYVTVDSALAETQKDNIEEVLECEEAVAEKQAEIDEIVGTGDPTHVSVKGAIIRAIKSAILGAIAGIVLLLSCYIVAGAISRKMRGNTSWKNFAIPVVGEVFTEKEPRKFDKVDKWIDKITGFAPLDMSVEDCSALAAANVLSVLKKNDASKAAVIGCADSELSTRIMSGMNKAAADVFSFAGDILKDPEAVNALSEIKDVILLADGEKITADEVGKMQTLLTAWGKELLGVILVK